MRSSQFGPKGQGVASGRIGPHGGSDELPVSKDLQRLRGRALRRSRGILEGSAKTKQLAQFGPDERPRSMQIFGCEPEAMGRATGTVCDEFGVAHIDMNFGCPVPKVTRKGMGAAALLNLENFRRVVGAVVKSADPIPVTIKVRLGMDDDYHTYVEAGSVDEGEGCQWIALHARTSKQM